eukprot:TRINITY_DN17922_c0_g1_i1.p1 TRINITY_DN17922_c0_g1~~TRINITY_DN17922_c0_g1_i1.p1  ORF type:complete len:373 (+),score=70.82 TRINITY_DN17922_c0_g1_i1:146-1264(+)
MVPRQRTPISRPLQPRVVAPEAVISLAIASSQATAVQPMGVPLLQESSKDVGRAEAVDALPLARSLAEAAATTAHVSRDVSEARQDTEIYAERIGIRWRLWVKGDATNADVESLPESLPKPISQFAAQLLLERDQGIRDAEQRGTESCRLEVAELRSACAEAMEQVNWLEKVEARCASELLNLKAANTQICAHGAIAVATNGSHSRTADIAAMPPRRQIGELCGCTCGSLGVSGGGGGRATASVNNGTYGVVAGARGDCCAGPRGGGQDGDTCGGNTGSKDEAPAWQALCEQLAEELANMHKAHAQSVTDACEANNARNLALAELAEARRERSAVLAEMEESKKRVSAGGCGGGRRSRTASPISGAILCMCQ